MHGLHVTLIVSAGLLLLGALAALRLPRAMECEGGPDPDPEHGPEPFGEPDAQARRGEPCAAEPGR